MGEVEQQTKVGAYELRSATVGRSIGVSWCFCDPVMIALWRSFIDELKDICMSTTFDSGFGCVLRSGSWPHPLFSARSACSWPWGAWAKGNESKTDPLPLQYCFLFFRPSFSGVEWTWRQQSVCCISVSIVDSEFDEKKIVCFSGS